MSQTPAAALYCRISQDRTGKKAGVQRQEEDCRKLAKDLGWDVSRVIVDNDASAYSSKRRPGYAALMEAVEAGEVTAIVAWHPDRLYRQMRDLVELVDVVKAHDVEIATVRAGRVDLSTASGRMHANMLGSVAAYESEIKSERVTRAAEQRAKAGRWSGGMRPYGYEPDGVTIREDEAAHIRRACADILTGVSLREATRRRIEAGAVSSTGKEWTSQHLRSALLSPRLAGLASYRGAIVGQAEWDGVLPEADWQTMRSILEDPSRRSTPGPAPKHLLSGIAVCGREDCGKPCRVSVGGGANRSRTLRYRCPRGHVIREKIALEAYVLSATFLLLEDNHVRAKKPTPTASAGSEAETIRRRLEALAEDYADGRLTREQLEAGTTRARARLAEVEAQVVSTTRTAALGQLAGDDPRSAWEGLSIAHQRAVLAELWTVQLHPMPSGHRGVNERGVTLVPRWDAA